MKLGLSGDTKPLGGSLHEVRIHAGPGYRIYYTQKGGTVLLLLIGGDKGSQSRDIAKARKMMLNLEWED
ncbi:MAG: addiction module killer protein [Verrucomicrobiae bacterium]|nr:addiction module killer protein [Verrucomicrobiae bacterium]